MRTDFVNRDSLTDPSQDTVGSLIRLLQGLSDDIYSHGDVHASVQVLSDKGLFGG